MSVAGLLPERCSIYYGTPGTDAQGFGTMNWGSPAATDVPCRLQLLWLSKDAQNYGEKNIAKGIIYIDGDIPLSDKNAALHVTEGPHSPRKFRITGVSHAADSVGPHHWEAFIEETDANFA